MKSDQARVFIIDDESDVRAALSMLIRSIGLEAETFSNALEFLVSYQPQWSGCIVADIRMPGMSGLELQEKLNAMGAEMPLIFISGHADVHWTCWKSPSAISACWTRCRARFGGTWKGVRRLRPEGSCATFTRR
jgi:FixJ family two-component response regulator